MTSLLKKLLADCFKTFSGQPEDWTVGGPCHLYYWPFSERKDSGLRLCKFGDTCSLKCSIAQLDSQDRKFVQILIITETKNSDFFVCKRIEFVHQRLRDFAKMTLTRVVKWLERVTIFLNATRVESESPKIVTRVDSLIGVQLSLVQTSGYATEPVVLELLKYLW